MGIQLWMSSNAGPAHRAGTAQIVKRISLRYQGFTGRIYQAA